MRIKPLLIRIIILFGLGAIYEAELAGANSTTRLVDSKVFNSAGEFLESVEDSRDSVWLVHIVMNDQATKPESITKSECSQERFIDASTWKKLKSLSKFGILTGTFNCANDMQFCVLKGWTKPQLVLGMVKYTYPKELVEFFYYTDCKSNTYQHINKWLEQTLRSRLVRPLIDAKSDVFNNFELKLYFKQEMNVSKQIPLFYSAMSFKYNRRAQFYWLTHAAGDLLQKYCPHSTEDSTVPIYVLIDNKICYNYGSNLNELPNYAHLDFFLTFLYPDTNKIFLMSFFVLNAFLVMIFFEYNESFIRQLLYGLCHLCIFNFVLFSLWMLTINSNVNGLVAVFNLISSNSKRLLVWCRYFMMFNSSTSKCLAHLRFILFYHIYVNTVFAAVSYLAMLIVFYWHTKRNYKRSANTLVNADLNILENNKFLNGQASVAARQR